MNEAKQIYFNFPVTMMQGILVANNTRKQSFLSGILYYHIQKHAQKMEALENFEQSELDLFKRSAEYWNIVLGGDIADNQKIGVKLINEHNESKVFVGINSEIFWDFYNNVKDDYQWKCLFAFLSLKSIIGKKSYCKSNNNLLFARMMGKETVKEYTETGGIGFTRYLRNKIINELEMNWHLKYYSFHNKGFYFGFLINLGDLIRIAEERRASFRYRSLQEYKTDLREKAIAELRSYEPK